MLHFENQSFQIFLPVFLCGKINRVYKIIKYNGFSVQKSLQRCREVLWIRKKLVFNLSVKNKSHHFYLLLWEAVLLTAIFEDRSVQTFAHIVLQVCVRGGGAAAAP